MKRVLFIGIGLSVTVASACGDKANDPEATASTGDSTTTDGTDTNTNTTSDPTGTSTTSTTTTDTATTTATTTDSGSGFIDPPDGGVVGQCDPQAQDCPRDEKCTAYSTDGPAPPASPWNANKCVPITGDAQAGDPCDIEGGKYTGEDNCAEGLICLLTDDDGAGGACVEFCDPNNNCSDPGAECVVYNDGALPICLLNCDPLLQDCPEGQGCYGGTGSSFICFKFSGMSGEGVPGDECNYVNACQPGTACLAPDAVEGCGAQAGCCSPFCDISDPNAADNCNPSEECTPWFERGMAPPQYEDVGVCAIPM